jgi:hypothetical protein
MKISQPYQPQILWRSVNSWLFLTMSYQQHILFSSEWNEIARLDEEHYKS